MIRRLVFLAVALGASLTGFAAAAQDVLFSYAFEAGSSHRYRVKMNQEVDFSGNVMGQIADFEVTVTCVSVAEDGSASMVMKFEKTDMSRQMFGNMVADPLSDMILGKGVAFTVDASGDVHDVKQDGYYEGWDQMSSFVEPLVKGWYVRLPGKAYAPGAEWDDVHQENGDDGSDVKATTHYKYKENKKQGGRDCASLNGDIVIEIGGQSSTGMGTFNVEGAGKGKAEILFDPAAHMIVKLKSKLNTDMHLTPPAGGDTMDASLTYQMERELL